MDRFEEEEEKEDIVGANQIKNRREHKFSLWSHFLLSSISYVCSKKGDISKSDHIERKKSLTEKNITIFDIVVVVVVVEMTWHLADYKPNIKTNNWNFVKIDQLTKHFMMIFKHKKKVSACAAKQCVW